MGRESARLAAALLSILLLAACDREAHAPDTSVAPRPAAPPPALSPELFEKALRNISTAPNYVLVTVVDGRTGDRQAVCLESMPFLSAICAERGIPWPEAADFALREPGRTYRFSKPKALASVARPYSDAVLAEAREILADRTLEEIVDATHRQESWFYEFCARKPGSYSARFPAIAHVLTERGMLCTRGCRPGMFDVEIGDEGD